MTKDYDSALRKMLDEREPDLNLKIWLVPHGYEARLTGGDGLLWSRSRDRAESMPVSKQERLLSNLLYDMLENLYKTAEVSDATMYLYHTCIKLLNMPGTMAPEIIRAEKDRIRRELAELNPYDLQ